MTREEAINKLYGLIYGVVDRQRIDDTCREVIDYLKAQENEALDMPKPDSDIGCWYDITHNYTLEQVVSALKSRELCEDAVSRKYLLSQSYSIKFQTIDESDEEAYREEVVCIEDIKDAPSVQPVPMQMDKLQFVYTSDVVNVVRCKDCKYRWDPIQCDMYSEGMVTPDDWFCADGERRDGDA